MRSESVYCIGDVHAWGEGTVGGGSIGPIQPNVVKRMSSFIDPTQKWD